MIEVFNSHYELLHDVGPLSQEEILSTPEYFAMSKDQILAHESCPEHLKKVLNNLAWTGRPNFVQVRPQDFRKVDAHPLGRGWHVDVNTNLVTGKEHWAKNLEEFKSMVVSFGDVVETEFVKKPFHIDLKRVDPMNHVQFASHVASLNPEVVALKPNQLARYTSKDAHRVSPNWRLGNARLIIVTVECDEALPSGAGEARPSILQRSKS